MRPKSTLILQLSFAGLFLILLAAVYSADQFITLDFQMQGQNSTYESITPPFPIDAMYIINQPARTDRLIDTLKMFHHLSLQPKVVDGVDKIVFESAKVRNPSWRACMESHRLALRKVVTEQNRHAIIFEDDIDIDIDFPAQIQGIIDHVGENWDIIFLGHCAEGQGVFEHAFQVEGKKTTIRKSKHPYCGHAYAIKYGLFPFVTTSYSSFNPSDSRAKIFKRVERIRPL